MATISCCLGFHSQNPPCLRGHLHLFSKNFQLRIRCETHTSWNLQERLHQKNWFSHDGLLRTLLWASNWLGIVMLKKLPPEALSGMVLECIRYALVFVYLLMFSVWSSHPSSVMGWFSCLVCRVCWNSSYSGNQAHQLEQRHPLSDPLLPQKTLAKAAIVNITVANMSNQFIGSLFSQSLLLLLKKIYFSALAKSSIICFTWDCQGMDNDGFRHFRNLHVYKLI